MPTMDVRCEHCGTEYELDDSQLAPSGVTVQCSKCAAIFKVARRPAALMIRMKRTGKEERLLDMSVLKEGVLEHRFTREDELSEGGKPWKALGQMPELGPLFDLAAREVPVRPSELAAAATTTSMTPVPGDMRPMATPSAPPVSRRATLTYASNNPPSSGPVQLGSTSSGFSMDSGFFSSTTSDVGFKVPTYRGRKIAFLFLLLLVGGGVALWGRRDRVKTLLGKGGTTVSPRVLDQARDAFLLDTDDGFAQAVALYSQALLDNREVHVALPALVDVLGTWALALREDANFLGERAKRADTAQESVALRTLAEERQRDFKLKLRTASDLGKFMLERMPESTDAHRAFALVATLAEASPEEVQRSVIRAGADHPGTFLVKGLVSLRGKRVAEAIQLLREAVDRSVRYPSLRATWLLAWVYMREGRVTPAKALLDEALKTNPAHERSQALLAFLGGGSLAQAQTGKAGTLPGGGGVFPAAGPLGQGGLPPSAPKGTESAPKGAAEGATKPVANPAINPSATPPAGVLPSTTPTEGGDKAPAGAPSKWQEGPPAPTGQPAQPQGQPQGQGMPSGQPSVPSAPSVPSVPSVQRPADPKVAAGENRIDRDATYESLVEQGNRLLERDRSKQAREAFDGALRIRPGGAEAEMGLGNVYLNDGQTGLAILHLQRAIDVGSNEAVFYMAEALRQNGQLKEAYENYKRYVMRGARGENAGIAERSIRDLEATLQRNAPGPGSGAPGGSAFPGSGIGQSGPGSRRERTQ